MTSIDSRKYSFVIPALDSVYALSSAVTHHFPLGEAVSLPSISLSEMYSKNTPHFWSASAPLIRVTDSLLTRVLDEFPGKSKSSTGEDFQFLGVPLPGVSKGTIASLFLSKRSEVIPRTLSGLSDQIGSLRSNNLNTPSFWVLNSIYSLDGQFKDYEFILKNLKSPALTQENNTNGYVDDSLCERDPTYCNTENRSAPPRGPNAYTTLDYTFEGLQFGLGFLSQLNEGLYSQESLLYDGPFNWQNIAVGLSVPLLQSGTIALWEAVAGREVNLKALGFSFLINSVAQGFGLGVSVLTQNESQTQNLIHGMRFLFNSTAPFFYGPLDNIAPTGYVGNISQMLSDGMVGVFAAQVAFDSAWFSIKACDTKDPLFFLFPAFSTLITGASTLISRSENGWRNFGIMQAFNFGGAALGSVGFMGWQWFKNQIKNSKQVSVTNLNMGLNPIVSPDGIPNGAMGRIGFEW